MAHVSHQLAHKLQNRLQAIKLALELTPAEEARLRMKKLDWAIKEVDELSRLIAANTETAEEEKARRQREAE